MTMTMNEKLKQIDFEVVRESALTPLGEDCKRDVIIRKDNRQILGVVGKKYGFVPHLEGFRKVSEALPNLGNFELTKLLTTAGGARMYATFMSDKSYDVGENDLLKPTLTLTNSYDGSLKFGFMLGAMRLVCSNGMMVGQKVFEMQARHSIHIDVPLIAKTASQAFNNLETHIMPIWKELKYRNVNATHVLNEISEQKKIPAKFVKKTISEFRENETVKLWDIYNSFTRQLTHEYDGSADRRIMLDTAVSKTFEAMV